MYSGVIMKQIYIKVNEKERPSEKIGPLKSSKMSSYKKIRQFIKKYELPCFGFMHYDRFNI